MPKKIEPKIVYACEICNKTHETEAAAIACEKACNKAKIASEKKHIAKEDFRNNLRLTCKSIPEIERYLENAFKEQNNTADFTVNLSVNYTASASNSHCSPLDGVTNWGSQADKPNGYPGFVGSISVSFKGEVKFPSQNGRYNNYVGSDEIQAFIGLHTGTGGVGGSSCRYGITLFLSDFPVLAAAFDEANANFLAAKTSLIQAKAASNEKVLSTTKYKTMQEESSEIYEKISELEEKVREIEDKMQAEISNAYKADCSSFEKSLTEAKAALIKAYKLSDEQATYILDMPLRRLTKLSKLELETEQKDLKAIVTKLKALLASEDAIKAQVSLELDEVSKNFATPRRTRIA